VRHSSLDEHVPTLEVAFHSPSSVCMTIRATLSALLAPKDSKPTAKWMSVTSSLRSRMSEPM
jgi:hypothetical protein